MKIKDWLSPQEQTCRIGNQYWNVARLFELSRHLPVMKIPLDHMYLYTTYKELSLREMVMHMRAVLNADMSKPIILDEDGEIMDGRHRLMNALLNEEETILAVRFDENPIPCRVGED